MLEWVRKGGANMTIGQKIQLLRKQRGWSQEKLAEELSVSRQALSKWELGTSVPDTENLRKISQLFAVSADYLLDDTRDAPESPQGPHPSRTVPSRFLLTERAKRLLAERGYAACYLLAAGCVPGLLVIGFLCFAYLSALPAPLRDLPLQAFMIPIAACILGIFLVARIVVLLVLAIQLKRLQRQK